MSIWLNLIIYFKWQKLSSILLLAFFEHSDLGESFCKLAVQVMSSTNEIVNVNYSSNLG